MSAENLYEFAIALEDPIAEILNARGLKTVTPRNSARFQEERPRVEIKFEDSQEKGSYHVLDNGELRNASWSGSLAVEIITPSGDTGADGQDASAAHRAFRAQVKNIFATLKWQLNGTRPDGSQILPFHEIQRINQNSNNEMYEADKGFESSKIAFNIDFGIRQSAWSELDNVQTFPATAVP